MKFGVCSQYELMYLKDIGYDYFEVPLSYLYSLSDEEFESFKADIFATGLKAEVAFLFLPGGFSIVDGTRSNDEIRKYAEDAFARFASVGGEVAVLGSSGQRKVPDGLDFDIAYSRLIEAIKIFCDVAKKYNIDIAIEPLNADETNMINTVAQAAELCERVNMDNFGCIADIYHLHRNGESIDTIKENIKYIKHIHLARRNNDRQMPYEEKRISRIARSLHCFSER